MTADEINKAALENKIILYRYEQRLCSERVRFSFAFVVCSVFLNSEQSQMVQDENDCREININKTNQKRRCVVRATISRVLARLDSLASTVLAQAADHYPIKEYNKRKFYHVLYDEQQISC